MNLKRIVTCLLLINVGFSTLGQSLGLLENALNTNQNLTVEKKLNLYDKLSWEFINSDADKAKKMSRDGIALSKAVKNDKMCGILYHHLGIACYHKSELDSAWRYFKLAEFYSTKANDDFRLDRIYVAYSILYDTESKQEKAIDILINLLPKLEKKKDLDLVRTVYGNLGSLYLYIHNYTLSEKYFKICAGQSLMAKDDWKLSQSYNGLIDIHIQKKEYEKALDFADKALEVAKRCDDIQGEALDYGKKSEIYYTHFKDLDKARHFAMKGLEIAKKGANISTIAELLSQLSNISYQKKDYQKSVEYAREAIQTDTTDLKVYENIAANMVKSSAFLGDKGNVIKYFNKYFEIVELRGEKELHKHTIDSEKKYQTEKKEQEIINLLKQKKLYGIITFTTLFSLLALFLLLYLRHKNIKVKKQLAEQKIDQLEQEKQLIATQAILEGETAERSRLARDLHDGLGGMLSVVKLKLNNMRGNIILPEADVTAFHHALGLLDGSIGELRRIARNLMPESLMRYGLKAAISDFCQGIDHVNFHYWGIERRHPEKMEIALFRIAQELVNNAIKHSAASQINVQLIDEGSRISLVVQDNGIGFDPESIKLTSTTGLSSVRSRIESLGGKFDLLSSSGNGTEAHIDLSDKNLTL